MTKSPIEPPSIFLEYSNAPVLAVVDHYAGNPKFLTKALEQFGTNPKVEVTVDLEDGAAVGQESNRIQELAEVAKRFPQSKVGLRIHPLDSPFWLSDLKIFLSTCGAQLSHVTIPKVDDVALVQVALDTIGDLRKSLKQSGSVGAHLLIETPAALEHIDALASLPGVRCLDFGIMDFVSCFGASLPRSAMSSPEQFTHPLVLAAKTKIVLAARAHGIGAAHNVTVKIKPASAAENDARQARELGFTRMWSIHPEQVEAIIKGFEPSLEERALAEKVLLKAQAQAWAPVEVDGILYDRASYRWLWNLLQ